MMFHHSPIVLTEIGQSFPAKTCFEGLSTTIHFGDRIAFIGRNGSGKSSLLRILAREGSAFNGKIIMPDDVNLSYVPQLVHDHDSLSGGQRFQKALSNALGSHPNVLLLDEPTNHLDADHRKALIHMLKRYSGTLIVATHDEELLTSCVDNLWHIDNGKVAFFHGHYSDYRRDRASRRLSLEKDLALLNNQKKDMHTLLMKEQKRNAKSRAKGEKSIAQRKWPTMVSTAKAGRAEETTGRKKAAIDGRKNALMEALSHLRLPEIIVPSFALQAGTLSDKVIMAIEDGRCSYGNRTVLEDIHFQMRARDRVALRGANGSGKTTLVKALLGDSSVTREGNWHTPAQMGYLDQHYDTLDPLKTVIETLHALIPAAPHAHIRQHLNDYLFRKNEEVNALVSTLSGGEKARLCLACIGILTPKLLILDEVTNNLDLETKQHVVDVLKQYPGALLLISHDEAFLHAVSVEHFYDVGEGTCGVLR